MSNSIYIDKLINYYKQWENYLEKKDSTAKYLYDKTANAGMNNYQCFADIMVKKYLNFFHNTKSLQGASWCTTFMATGLCETFGEDMAHKMTGIPVKSYAAVVTYWKNYMDSINRIYSTPIVGSFVFFGNQHIGMVIQVNSNGSFKTIEGNTSAGSTVVSNGGGVSIKTYSCVQSTYKFGMPLYGLVDKNYKDPIVTLKKGDKNTSVKDMQERLVKLGFNTNGIDSSFGTGSETAVKAFQKKYGLTVDGVAGPITLNKLIELTTAKTSATTSTTTTTITSATSKTSTTTTVTTTTTSCSITMPSLSKGMTKSVYVAMMQEALKFKGYTIDVDGGFGAQTETIVKTYQGKCGLTKDGVWGKQCWESLGK